MPGRRRASVPARRRGAAPPRRVTAVLAIASIGGGGLMARFDLQLAPWSVSYTEAAPASAQTDITRVRENGDSGPARQRVVRGAVMERAPAAIERTSIVEAGPGVFSVAPAQVVSASLSATTYRVEVEQGLPFDVAQTAAFIEAVLTDRRGWSSVHDLVRVDGAADLRIAVATPATTDALCAPLDTGGRLSCRNGANVVLNGWRWAYGAETYGNDLVDYRRYLVNHETGHALGYPHVGCPATGQQAPVMLQQTKGLGGCRPNSWPGEADLTIS